MQALVALQPASERNARANDDQSKGQSRANIHLAAEQQRNAFTAGEWLAALASQVRRGEDTNPFGQPARVQNQALESELDCSDIPRIINLRLPASHGDGCQLPVESGARPRVHCLDESRQSLPSAVPEKRLRASLTHVSNHSIPGKPAPSPTAAPRFSQTPTAQIPLGESFGPVPLSQSISGNTSACLPALTADTGMSSMVRPLPSPPAFPNPQMESKLIHPLSLASCDYAKAPHRGEVITTSFDHSSRDHPVPSHTCNLIDWNSNGKPLLGYARDLAQPTTRASVEQTNREPLASRMNSKREDRQDDRSSSRQASRRSPSSSNPSS